MKKSISIIIPYHKKFINPNLIKELKSQSFKNFEVIFLDSYKTKKYENPILKKEDKNLKYYSCGNPVSFKRNKGVNLSDGEFIIFIDDDCSLPESWLQELNNSKENDKIVYGNVINDDPKNYNINIPEVATNNIILKKINFRPFNNIWQYAAFEDFDWSRNSYNKGIPSIQKITGVLFHPKHKGIRLIKKRFLYGQERMKYEREHSTNSKFVRRVGNSMIIIFGELAIIFGQLVGGIKYWIFRAK